MPKLSIRILLLDGTPLGIRTAELGMSTIKAVVVPRASLSLVAGRAEVQKPGVYILVGPDSDKPGQRKVYLGETDKIVTRLAAHNKDADKDFWDEAVIFVAKDEGLTKSHGRYLEARLIALAAEAKRATVTNSTSPSGEGMLPEGDEADMEAFIAQARLLIGTLGYDIFEPAQSQPAPPNAQTQGESVTLPTFKLTGENFDATCIVDVSAGQFVVKAGSTARKQTTPSLAPGYRSLRDQLIQNGVLVNNDENSYRFVQDYSFGAASPAAQIVSGTTLNGRTAWKSQTDGKTLAEWQDSMFPAESGS